MARRPHHAPDNPADAPGDTAQVPRAAATPALWLDAAMALLVDGGVDLIRVDVIARQLQLTRGSFYWHFKDRDALLAALLQAWRQSATEQVTERFSRDNQDPRALIRELLSLPFRGRSAQRAARVELAIRDWARRDAMARQAVDEADATRIDYIARCFRALGFGTAEAQHRAGILYACELGEALLVHQGAAPQQRERSALLERLLLAPLPR